ncbi:MAG TPA: 50S ribosomal protein L9 [Gammaproteobacteria bacterium]|jgi:large subunit ribosomal protein L9
MDVILMEKVDNLGDLGEKVSVKPGFARNYLVPSGKAKFATATNVAEFEARRAELEKLAAEAKAEAEERKAKAEGLKIVIVGKAGTEGKLFGSIGPREVADAITAAGLEVEKKEIRMPEGPIRMVGMYDVVLHLHADIDVELSITVDAEE